MALRDAILSSDDRGREIVDVPEWGVKLEIREPNVGQRAALIEGYQSNTGLAWVYSSMLVATAYDPETGERVFTEDATAEYGPAGNPRGLPAIIAVVRASLEPLDASQHFIGTSLVEANADGGADGRTYLIARHIRHGTPGGEHYTIAGTYIDRFVRTPEGWRIRHRRLTHTWTRGNPAVLSSSGRAPTVNPP